MQLFATAAVLMLGAAAAPSRAASSDGGVQQSAPLADQAGAQPAALPAPTGQAARYVIPFYTSQTVFSTARSVTVVGIFNNSNVACSVFVQFQFASQTSSICTITATVPARTSAQLCSRPVGDPLAPCNASCPGGGLTFNTGHAYVGSSTAPPGCKTIAVDPRIYYTTGSDSVILGSSQLSLVPVNAANKGD
ncbi:hypothetical protein CR492_09285 [Methylocella silvestris]|uniref:Uncharacterized protein n=1 Tax=Methylocella silvestris TaxID=199596 RepID=A0A2J7THQ8_METSI|nr:hypothetical protein CR492_09285 [Methylocella silvestris]